MKKAVAFAVCTVAASLYAGAAAAEVVLRAATSLPSNLEFSQSFLKNFVEPLNQQGKGVISINYVGGPETTPAPRMGSALSRGLFDILHGPASYYAGEVPEANALNATTVTIEELQRNGGMDYLNQIWKKKLNARILTWAETGVRYHFFLTGEPRINDQGLDLAGMKIRTTPTYRAFLDKLGASAINISVSELYTGLERGLVQGLGYTEIGMSVLGVGKFIKYRVDPAFYHSPVLLIMNANSYAKLPDNARAILDKVLADYRTKAPAMIKQRVDEDQAALTREGMKVMELKGPGRKAYLDAAYSSLWAQLAKEVEDVEKLKSILYRPE